MWDIASLIASLDAMEKTAQHEYDGCCNKKINGAWLEVKSLNCFEYRYNNRLITRWRANALFNYCNNS